MISTRYLVPFLGLLACSHDSQRANPFDPGLTPAVRVQAALDDTAGNVRLSWTAYEGRMPFARYQVERKVQGLEAVDTLAIVEEQQQTAYVDTSARPDTAYEYVVAVVNGSGFRAASETVSVGGFSVGAVRLTAVEPDPATGAVRLRWTQYADAAFQAYRVLRRVAGQQDSVLADLASRVDTTYVDTSAVADTDYLYRVAVLAAGEEVTSPGVDSRLALPGVVLTEPGFDAARASAALSWSRYEGPRFAAYEIRRSDGSATAGVATLSRRTTTSYTDSGLIGDTEYTYEIVVRTLRDEVQVSNAASGRFHRLVASWPLELEEGYVQFGGAIRVDPYVRLYARSGQGVEALLAGPTRIYLQSIDRVDGPEHKKLIIRRAVGAGTADPGVPFLIPRSTDLATDGLGRRWLLVTASDQAAILEIDEEGHPVFGPELRYLDEELEEIVLGPTLENLQISGVRADLERVVLRDDSGVLLEDDFILPEPDVWDELSGRREAGRLFGDDEFSVWRQDLQLGDFELTADLALQSEWWNGVNIVQGAVLVRTGLPAPGGALVWPGLQASYSGAFLLARVLTTIEGERTAVRPVARVDPLLGMPYRLRLSVRDGRLAVSVADPVLWADSTAGQDWAALTALEDLLLLNTGAGISSLSAESVPRSLDPLAAIASDVRTWQVDGPTGPEARLGVVLPGENAVRFGLVVPQSSGQIILPWSPGVTETSLSDRVGSGDGQLLIPVSMAVGPDERMYVLDAGNARIQVFEGDGSYLTQWGRAGSGPGEFDFGSGLTPEDFAGSIAVDDDGFIWVADVGNRRIQIFEP